MRVVLSDEGGKLGEEMVLGGESLGVGVEVLGGGDGEGRFFVLALGENVGSEAGDGAAAGGIERLGMLEVGSFGGEVVVAGLDGGEVVFGGFVDGFGVGSEGLDFEGFDLGGHVGSGVGTVLEDFGDEGLNAIFIEL